MIYNATCPACGLKRTWSRDMQDPGCSCTKAAELKRKISLQNNIELRVEKKDRPIIIDDSVPVKPPILVETESTKVDETEKLWPKRKRYEPTESDA